VGRNSNIDIGRTERRIQVEHGIGVRLDSQVRLAQYTAVHHPAHPPLFTDRPRRICLGWVGFG
jgi:hypothetical protein